MHPDRNYGNVEAATERFADIQSAYEVLSDPQERAWYDAHRDNILSGADHDEEHFVQNLHVTTSYEVLRFFTKIDFRIDSWASPKGIFQTIDEFFDGLAKEEEAASRWGDLEPIQYPSFGRRDDSNEDVVRPFYAMWSGFATAKSFSWKDVYRYSEAPDRRARRMMEKENKRIRDDGIREFNDAVRSLVAFIRKRDPRAKPNKQGEADRQRLLREAAIAQAARSRAAHQAKIVEEAVPEWTNSTSNETAAVFDDEKAESDIPRHEVECVVCNKTFKSEQQYEAHERSKKHVKAVQQLRRQMLRDNHALNLDDTENKHEKSDELPAEIDELSSERERISFEQINVECEHNTSPDSPLKDGEIAMNTQVSSEASSAPITLGSKEISEQDYVPAEGLEQSVSDEDKESKADMLREEQPGSSPDREPLETPVDAVVTDNVKAAAKPRIGKAKEKRAKKAAQKSILSNELHNDSDCVTCHQPFTSKTQLFKHLKSTGHAQFTGKQRQGKG